MGYQLDFIHRQSGYGSVKYWLLLISFIIFAPLQAYTGYYVSHLFEVFSESIEAGIQFRVILLFVCMTITSSLGHLYRITQINKFAFRFERNTSKAIMNNLFIDNLNIETEENIGKVQTLISSRIRSVRDFIIDSYESLIYNPFIFLCNITAIFFINKKVCVFVVLCVIICTILNFKYASKAEKYADKYFNTQSEFYSYQKEMVDQYEMTIMSNIISPVLATFSSKAKNTVKDEVSMLKHNQYAYIPALLNEYLPTVILILLIILSIIFNYISVTYSEAMALLILVSGISLPLSHTLKSYVFLASFKPIIDDIKRLLSKNNKSNIEFNNTNSSSALITVSSVKYSYPSSNYELIIPNLSIREGDKILISGKSGSGKTTFLKLIMGMVNAQNGKIVVSANSVSNSADYWKEISHVDNNTHILYGSLLYNVTLQTKIEDVDKERYVKLITELRIADLDNYEFWQNGNNLSGGQKMKICIARALYKNSRLIILDEPLAFLDKNSQEDVIDIISTLTHTCVIASNKIDIIRCCNRHFEVLNGVVYER